MKTILSKRVWALCMGLVLAACGVPEFDTLDEANLEGKSDVFLGQETICLHNVHNKYYEPFLATRFEKESATLAVIEFDATITNDPMKSDLRAKIQPTWRIGSQASQHVESPRYSKNWRNPKANLRVQGWVCAPPKLGSRQFDWNLNMSIFNALGGEVCFKQEEANLGKCSAHQVNSDFLSRSCDVWGNVPQEDTSSGYPSTYDINKVWLAGNYGVEFCNSKRSQLKAAKYEISDEDPIFSVAIAACDGVGECDAITLDSWKL